MPMSSSLRLMMALPMLPQATQEVEHTRLAYNEATPPNLKKNLLKHA
jgi:hypothetical protein